MQLTSFFAFATLIASVAAAVVPTPAAANIAKPFPGGGDFRDFPGELIERKTISVRF